MKMYVVKFKWKIELVHFRYTFSQVETILQKIFEALFIVWVSALEQ